MATKSPPLVLYHYPFSPYARRILWYLQLRGIPYAECRQPPILPRPDLSTKLGVQYRRIPVLAIGKDVYCDTRLILEKLEKFYPEGAIGAKTPDQLALQQLLSRWTTDGGLFLRSSQLIPSSLPLLSDPKFTKDREQLTGRKWDKAAVDRSRPEALAFVRAAFQFLEEGLLSDGRDWIFSGQQPTLGDIEAVWCLDWLTTLPGALPKDSISGQNYPKVFSWIARFNKAIKAASSKGPKATKLDGAAAQSTVCKAEYAESQGRVDELDPLGLQSGTKVQVWPIDSGFSHKDTGTLLSLSVNEVVIGLENDVRLHFPRTGFRIQEAADGAKL